MARVQAQLGPRATLPVFFTGHEANGAPGALGRARASRLRLRRSAKAVDHCRAARSRAARSREGPSATTFRTLDQALDDFRELRAGEAGTLALVPCPIEMQEDPLFAPSGLWESLTPYRVTRHAKMNDPARALEADLLAECRRGGLPETRSRNYQRPLDNRDWACSAARS